MSNNNFYVDTILILRPFHQICYTIVGGKMPATELLGTWGSKISNEEVVTPPPLCLTDQPAYNILYQNHQEDVLF